MNAGTTAAVFMELDVCKSLFDSLAYQLEHNEGITDTWSLAVLALEGKRKIGGIVERIDRGNVQSKG